MNTGYKYITVIDFRTDEARVLELSRHEKNWQITRTNTARIEFSELNERTIKNVLSGSEGSKFSSKTSRIFLLIPSHLATTKLMNLPPVSSDIMHQAVEFAVKEEYQSDNLRWDSNIVKSGNTSNAFVIAVRQSELESLEKTFSSISRKMVFASTTACCGINLLNKQDLPVPPKACVLLDLDPSNTTLTIANSNGFLYCRTITKGFEENNPRWIAEVTQTINYFKSQNSNTEIDNIYACGKGLSNTDILRNLGESAGLKVREVNLKGKLESLGIKENISPEYSAALACALGQIKPVTPQLNLIPHRATAPIIEALEQLWIHSAKFVISTCCILGLLIVGGISSKLLISNMQEKRLESHEQVLENIERMKVEQKSLQQVFKNRTGWADFYLFLAEELDKQMTLTQINLDTKEGIRIEGQAKNTEQIGNFVKQLNSSKYVKEVRLSRTSKDKGKMVFTLSGKIKN